MDRRMIEIAKMHLEFGAICKAHTRCGGCPMTDNQGICIGADKRAYERAVAEMEEDRIRAEKLVEAEEQADKEEALGYLGKVGELEKAIKTLEDYCDSREVCEGCVYYADGGCSIGAPVLWDGRKKTPEIYKDMDKKEETPAEKRKRVLDDAVDAVCKDRCEMYGEVEDNFGVIAGMWNAYLNAGLPEGACKMDLGATQVAEMMILFKVGRAATAMETHRDTYVDIAGYAACAGGMCDEENV